MNIPVDWPLVAPAVVVLAGALVALLVDAFYPRRTWNGSELPSVAALLGAGALAQTYRDDLGTATFAFTAIVLVGTLFVVVAANIMNFETAMPPGEKVVDTVAPLRRPAIGAEQRFKRLGRIMSGGINGTGIHQHRQAWVV